MSAVVRTIANFDKVIVLIGGMDGCISAALPAAQLILNPDQDSRLELINLSRGEAGLGKPWVFG